MREIRSSSGENRSDQPAINDILLAAKEAPDTDGGEQDSYHEILQPAPGTSEGDQPPGSTEKEQELVEINPSDAPHVALVTGDDGFVGSHFVETLLEAGWIVYGLDLQHNEAKTQKLQTRFVNRYHPIEGSLTNKRLGEDLETVDFMCDDGGTRAIGAIFRDFRIDKVVNLAALPIEPDSWKDEGASWRVNRLAAEDLMIAWAEYWTEMGMPDGFMMIQMSTVKAAVDGESPYARHKQAAERLVRFLTSEAISESIRESSKSALPGEVPIAVARSVNVYGPSDPNTSRLMPDTITHILRGEPVTLDKDNIHHSREYIFVRELCNGLRAALEVGKSGEVIPFSSGVSLENIEVVQMIQETAQDLANRGIIAPIGVSYTAPFLVRFEAGTRPKDIPAESLPIDRSNEFNILQFSIREGIEATIIGHAREMGKLLREPEGSAH